MFKNIVKPGSIPSIAGRKYQSAVAPKQGRYHEEKLSLPNNIDPNEATRFSTQRSRELNSSSILTHHSNFVDGNKMDRLDITLDNSSSKIGDPHVKYYDSHNAVSLNSVMQSNVPQPFGGLHNYAISQAMPGGGVMSLDKYQAGYMQGTHYTTLRQEFRKNWHQYDDGAGINSGQKNKTITNDESSSRSDAATNAKPNEKPEDTKPLTKRDQLKRAIKEYGSTVIVFHIGISLMSLGSFYLLVSSGLDVAALLDKLGVSAEASGKIMQGASTFVIAYAVHKIFAPVRISITLFSTPFIVRYLRLKGILKPPTPK
uniref:CSON009580 protein n=1 Tax=Culicoides sonorensis TaxID=179676 RepID=A0A336M0D1_CULSO